MVKLDFVYCPRCGRSHEPGKHGRKSVERVVKLEAAGPHKAVSPEGSAAKAPDKVGPTVVEAAAPKVGFDRVAYQREYMRKWRERKKERK